MDKRFEELEKAAKEGCSLVDEGQPTKPGDYIWIKAPTILDLIAALREAEEKVDVLEGLIQNSDSLDAIRYRVEKDKP